MVCFRYIIVNSLHKEINNNNNNNNNNSNVTNLDPKATSSRRVHKCPPVILPLDLPSESDFITTAERFHAIFDSPYIYLLTNLLHGAEFFFRS